MGLTDMKSHSDRCNAVDKRSALARKRIREALDSGWRLRGYVTADSITREIAPALAAVVMSDRKPALALAALFSVTSSNYTNVVPENERRLVEDVAILIHRGLV
jgi:hypothetical protein